MKIALTTDEIFPIHQVIFDELKKRGHDVVLFGAFQTQKEEPWVKCALEAAQAIQKGDCEEGIFFCWTGTGISIAANKVKGIRAALCGDSETAKGARIWNDANVLCLSNRLLSEDLAQEILEAWFLVCDGTQGEERALAINMFEERS
ncbi:Ribose-5-phosphate isomerase B [Candidatus Bealeia paramacronuclearis]|uniref:Ribose-5-phosphate isomerase B n=1 Tax=Candidatus Bealeia paramacronuclearis TaxID=1921001 RepID=A0ABZ2C2Q9_9PROT|nr:Ribose-5-phosphate isomerase B [Candidatus Bealeia paramacronuclearis]